MQNYCNCQVKISPCSVYLFILPCIIIKIAEVYTFMVNKYHLGNYIYVAFSGDNFLNVVLYNGNELVKQINCSDKVAKKLLITEAVELGATKTKIASSFEISRQTIDNYLEIKKHFGVEGLIHSYAPRKSKNTQTHRQDNASAREKGNKVRKLEEIKKAKLDARPKQLRLPLEEPPVEEFQQPYQEEHKWTYNRYAGMFSYLIVLVTQYDWLRLVQSFYGPIANLFLVFLFMVARNIRSIEQLKNERLGEIASILGISEKPSRKKVRYWLSQAISSGQAKHLLNTLFLYQVRTGIIGLWLWFTDNHLLTYTGQNRVHKSYNTQRRLMVPGQTNMVTTDQTGRIVDFDIQEGKGNIRQRLFDLFHKWKQEVPRGPVMVFDREVYGAKQFYHMNQESILFVTWEKYTKPQELDAIPQENFTIEFYQNKKTYRVFEDEISLNCTAEDGNKHIVKLRRIYIWNVTSNRRTCGLSNAPGDVMSTEECTRAILCRWGASENTFKHLGDKHPLHYHPGRFSMDDSEYQNVANPEYYENKRRLSNVKKELDTIYRKLSKSKKVLNKDGTPRSNSAWMRLSKEKENKEAELENLKQAGKNIPNRIDNTDGFRRFQQIDTESKNLFDFVTASVWNVRKQMSDWLLAFYKNKDEYVDLLYTITQCHGWIQSDSEQVRVRLEPLEQPSRRAAQEQLCRKLSALNAKTPQGKNMIIEVGSAPQI